MAPGSRILKKLPYDQILYWKDNIKKRLFTKEWSETVPTAHVDMTANELESLLRDNHFEEAYMSYDYESAVLDLRRAEGVENDKQMEVHIRCRPHPEKSGLQACAHVERSRYEHKEEHINGKGLVWLKRDEINSLLSGLDG